MQTRAAQAQAVQTPAMQSQTAQTQVIQDTWHWRYSHRDLNSIDLVANLVESICRVCGLDGERPRLHMVMGEVMSNAIDHGLLRLDSALKNNTRGFEHYLAERTLRLERLTVGNVRVTVEKTAEHMLRIAVQDSGSGFDYRQLALKGATVDSLDISGRGLLMLKHLCRSVTHSGCGNCIVVEFEIGSMSGL